MVSEATLPTPQVPNFDTVQMPLGGREDHADLILHSHGLVLPLLQELAGLLPDNILPPINQAICLYQLQHPEEAAVQIAQARSLAPDNPQMLYSLGNVCTLLSRLDEGDRRRS